MLTYYFSKGSSAVAAHILLEDVGAVYEAVEVAIPKAAHQEPAFLEKNPKGRIPLLQTSDGMISENPAILEYIAATHPQAGALPHGPFAQAQARSLAAYLCATVHVAFAHKQRGRRWADGEAALQDMAARTPRNLRDCAALLEQMYEFAPWVLGKDYSFCDPYVFLVGQWAAAAGVAITDFPKLAAHRSAMMARPATMRVLEWHGLL